MQACVHAPPMQASKVPVSACNIEEMINLMDMDKDGLISWKEFEVFFMWVGSCRLAVGI